MSNNKSEATWHPYGGAELVDYLEARRRANVRHLRLVLLVILVVVCIAIPVLLARHAAAERQDMIDQFTDDMIVSEVL